MYNTTNDSNSFPSASKDFISRSGSTRRALYRREVAGERANQRRCQRSSLRLAIQDAAAAAAAATYMTSLNYVTPALTSHSSYAIG